MGFWACRYSYQFLPCLCCCIALSRHDFNLLLKVQDVRTFFRFLRCLTVFIVLPTSCVLNLEYWKRIFAKKGFTHIFAYKKGTNADVLEHMILNRDYQCKKLKIRQLRILAQWWFFHLLEGIIHLVGFIIFYLLWLGRERQL